jgi:hypothetical protein
MKHIDHQYAFVVVGGGLAGICAAVTASRKGVKTALVHDRPVLGGNASTEIRVPPVGATQCNFAYSRETGIIEELFLNNLYRNPTWSQEGWNLELESLVRNESNLDLFLNSTVCKVETTNSSTDTATKSIHAVVAYCSMAETWHRFEADYFADCSGDGVVGASAGAHYRYGVEAKSEFNERMCPEFATPETMGMSLQMRARNVGRFVPFIKPEWVKLTLQAEDFGPYRPVSEQFFPDTGGFWWLEWGGALDTIHDTMAIKNEVQGITIAVWDYLKNRSPIAQQLESYELDWLGAVPGKRESRRFEGDHILTMHDIDTQAYFEDAVAFGGWGFDHHPPGGFHDKINPSTHEYLPGPHNVPLRSLYSRNITNLFFAGRNISATHYALSSTRVMLTCAQLGEAVGMAAAQVSETKNEIRLLNNSTLIRNIQQNLQCIDHHIHACPILLDSDCAPKATVSASSIYHSSEASTTWATEYLQGARMQMISVNTSEVDEIQIKVDVLQTTILQYSFHQGPANASTFPEVLLCTQTVELLPGESQWVNLPIHCKINLPGWHFLIFENNPYIRLHVIESPPGQLRYYPRPEDPIRPNPFSTWTLRSLAIGQNKAADADGAPVTAPSWNEYALQFKSHSPFLAFSYACKVWPEQPIYEPQMVVNQFSRPTNLPNLWVSGITDFNQPEWINLEWNQPVAFRRIQILFDSALHFHFGQSWQGYQVNAIPSIVKQYKIVANFADGTVQTLVEVTNNFQRNRIHSIIAENVTKIKVLCYGTNGIERAQIYAIRVLE